MSLLTAWQFMIELGHDEPNPLQPNMHEPVPLEGKTVLINGAAGGVGHFAVQIAKWKGARVIAVASGEHEAFVRDLGADDSSTTQRPLPRMSSVTSISSSTRLAARPLVVFCARSSVAALCSRLFLGLLRRRGGREAGVTVSATQVRSSGAQLAKLADLLDAGTIRVAVDSTFPLADARKAHERAARGHIRGKIVLTVR